MRDDNLVLDVKPYKDKNGIIRYSLTLNKVPIKAVFPTDNVKLYQLAFLPFEVDSRYLTDDEA